MRIQNKQWQECKSGYEKLIYCAIAILGVGIGLNVLYYTIVLLFKYLG